MMGAKPPYEFRHVRAGVETLAGLFRPRHHHSEGYATIVLAGSVTEVSFAGRMHAEPGHVLLHGRFDCHLDSWSRRRSLQILRLPWPHDAIEGHYHVMDPDALARLSEVDPERASARLYEEVRRVVPRDRYWVDDLAEFLRSDSNIQLQTWAETRSLRPDTLSYVFRREFGVSPKRFRLEARTRSAWLEILRSPRSLTDVALQAGFADLAHLSRSVRMLTGRTPKDWRSSRSVNA
jgi:AraC-like DNA-binding protein